MSSSQFGHVIDLILLIKKIEGKNMVLKIQFKLLNH